ncbi:MAG: protein translocase subunit SecF [Spirochaetales bacterium]|jgi:preprotein translocase subunit SecF|nr:protein translocase subunit SecF [Spirochaetales bacterium]
MKVIQFLKYGKLTIIISLLCIAGGIAATIVQGGFNLGLDFQAGLSQQMRIEGAPASIGSVRDALQNIDGVQIQETGAAGAQEYIIKVKQQGSGSDITFQEDMRAQIFKALEAAFGAQSVKELQSEYVGPRFSSDLASQTILLTLFALLLILVYCWFRFKLGYAVAAIAATIHDTLFMVGVIGAFQFEVSTATVAAILTIIGYSLNDTIVIFDRIRENSALLRESPFPLIINTSTTQSLSRTIITSLTTLLAIVALYIFGSGDVRQFALNMIIGVVVGTYSSLFIACPVLNGWKNTAERRRRKKDASKSGVSHEARAIAEKPVQSVQEAAAAVEETPQQSAAYAAEADAGKQTLSRRMSREERKRKSRR